MGTTRLWKRASARLSLIAALGLILTAAFFPGKASDLRAEGDASSIDFYPNGDAHLNGWKSDYYYVAGYPNYCSLGIFDGALDLHASACDGSSDWHVKAYKSLSLTSGTYSASVSLKASKALTSVTFYADCGFASNPGNWSLSVSTSEFTTTTLSFTLSATTTVTFYLQPGNNTGPFDLYLEHFGLFKSDAATVSDPSSSAYLALEEKKWRFASFAARLDSSSSGTIATSAEAAELDLTTQSTDRASWPVNFSRVSDIPLTSGHYYRFACAYWTNQSFTFDFKVCSDLYTDTSAYSAYTIAAMANSNATYEVTFQASQSLSLSRFTFLLGNLTSGGIFKLMSLKVYADTLIASDYFMIDELSGGVYLGYRKSSNDSAAFDGTYARLNYEGTSWNSSNNRIYYDYAVTKEFYQGSLFKINDTEHALWVNNLASAAQSYFTVNADTNLYCTSANRYKILYHYNSGDSYIEVTPLATTNLLVQLSNSYWNAASADIRFYGWYSSGGTNYYLGGYDGSYSFSTTNNWPGITMSAQDATHRSLVDLPSTITTFILVRCQSGTTTVWNQTGNITASFSTINTYINTGWSDFASTGYTESLPITYLVEALTSSYTSSAFLHAYSSLGFSQDNWPGSPMVRLTPNISSSYALYTLTSRTWVTTSASSANIGLNISNGNGVQSSDIYPTFSSAIVLQDAGNSIALTVLAASSESGAACLFLGSNLIASGYSGFYSLREKNGSICWVLSNTTVLAALTSRYNALSSEAKGVLATALDAFNGEALTPNFSVQTTITYLINAANSASSLASLKPTSGPSSTLLIVGVSGTLTLLAIAFIYFYSQRKKRRA